jgi:hypothetical protein
VSTMSDPTDARQTAHTRRASGWVHIGLDGEMSAADLSDGGRLIQAGAAAWSAEPGGPVETFTSLIRHDQLTWCDRAAQVHGITRDQLADAPAAAEVDEALRAWLLAHGGTDGKRRIVPVGLNVAAFDLPFFRHSLPGATELLARRSVDLNALCFTYAGWDPNPRTATTRDFAGWKRAMKTAANAALTEQGRTVREHDAGYDAAQALVGWWWLRGQLTDSAARLARMEQHLDTLDPLRAALGDGLLARLSGIPRPALESIVAALGPDVSVRRWFGTHQPALGQTPLQALQAGRLAEILAAASTY